MAVTRCDWWWCGLRCRRLGMRSRLRLLWRLGWLLTLAPVDVLLEGLALKGFVFADGPDGYLLVSLAFARHVAAGVGM